MLEKVQQITTEKDKQAKLIEDLGNDLFKKSTILNNLEQQLAIFKNDSNQYKHKYSITQQDSTNKTHEIEKMKIRINEVNIF